MVSSAVRRSVAVVAATLLLAACDDLLPRRQSPPVAAAADSAPATTRPRRQPPARDTQPEATALEAEAAFGQIRQSLRRLVAAEQGFYAENGTYSRDLQRVGFRPAGESQVEFVSVTKQGWAARGTHPALPGSDCVTYAGAATTPPATRRFARTGSEGVIVCDSRAVPAPARPAPAAPAPSARAAPVAADTANALDAVNPTVQMRVDLRKLGEAQAAYYGTQGLYSRDVERLQLQFAWQRGVEVKLLHADQRSWSARATHTARPGSSCVVWYGVPPARPATQAQRKVPERPGVPVCDD